MGQLLITAAVRVQKGKLLAQLLAETVAPAAHSRQQIEGVLQVIGNIPAVPLHQGLRGISKEIGSGGSLLLGRQGLVLIHTQVQIEGLALRNPVEFCAQLPVFDGAALEKADTVFLLQTLHHMCVQVKRHLISLRLVQLSGPIQLVPSTYGKDGVAQIRNQSPGAGKPILPEAGGQARPLPSGVHLLISVQIDQYQRRPHSIEIHCKVEGQPTLQLRGVHLGDLHVAPPDNPFYAVQGGQQSLSQLRRGLNPLDDHAGSHQIPHYIQGKGDDRVVRDQGLLLIRRQPPAVFLGQADHRQVKQRKGGVFQLGQHLLPEAHQYTGRAAQGRVVKVCPQDGHPLFPLVNPLPGLQAVLLRHI